MMAKVKGTSLSFSVLTETVGKLRKSGQCRGFVSRQVVLKCFSGQYLFYSLTYWSFGFLASSL